MPYMESYKVRSVDVEWTNVGDNTDVTPDTDKEFNLDQARSIWIQFTTTAGNTSTDLDLNVEHSADGTTWVDTPVGSITGLGDGGVEAVAITAGPPRMRLRLDQNDVGKKGYAKATVVIRR